MLNCLSLSPFHTRHSIQNKFDYVLERRFVARRRPYNIGLPVNKFADIHSFVTNVCIATLQESYSEAFTTAAQLNTQPLCEKKYEQEEIPCSDERMNRDHLALRTGQHNSRRRAEARPSKHFQTIRQLT